MSACPVSEESAEEKCGKVSCTGVTMQGVGRVPAQEKVPRSLSGNLPGKCPEKL